MGIGKAPSIGARRQLKADLRLKKEKKKYSYHAELKNPTGSYKMCVCVFLYTALVLIKYAFVYEEEKDMHDRTMPHLVL